jgi:hypothetical protein
MAADSEAGKTWPALSVVVACALAFTLSGLLGREAIAAWLIIPVALGWFVLAGRLTAGA